MTTTRYAIYYVPPEGSALSAFGRRWFGDCGPLLAGLSRERRNSLTARCRQYGFHATLKAPFRLRRATSAAELAVALAAFARQQPSVHLPPLRLGTIGNFLALVPRGPAAAVGRLAGDCVRAFDRFRAPPSYAERLRRRAAGLSGPQAELLARWGYPYVMPRYRFHLTLTDPLRDARERAAIATGLSPVIAFLGRAPLIIDALCLVRQDNGKGSFVLDRKFSLNPHPKA